MKFVSKKTIAVCSILNVAVDGFASTTTSSACGHSATALNFFGGGSGAKDLDEEWERQQEILRLRKDPEARQKYFDEVEERRAQANKEQTEKWAWQKKEYGKGEDPIDEWKKRRESGQISDLENQYGDPEEIGGIPLPMASFGVGGEFGVGGKFDNGGRFDLRLPYAEQGWVDEDAEPFYANWFGGGTNKKSGEVNADASVEKSEPNAAEPAKKGFWPF
mmetsp:Transcript_18814/g.39395  ORF Transcript_18814/g.39395 Transcript_18814/m.39395 type:complete len:219 (-) Transcript_18814:2823-3479(-)